jgi:hypothetical protein
VLGEEAAHFLGKGAFSAPLRKQREAPDEGTPPDSIAQGREGRRRTQGGIRKAREGHPLELDAGKACVGRALRGRADERSPRLADKLDHYVPLIEQGASIRPCAGSSSERSRSRPRRRS